MEKKSLAYQIIYRAVKKIQQKTEINPLYVLRQAIHGVTPGIIVKARSAGGSTHQIPIEIGSIQGKALAFRWLLAASRKRPGRNMAFKLSSELVDAAKGSCDAIRKRKRLIEWQRQIELLHMFPNPKKVRSQHKLNRFGSHKTKLIVSLTREKFRTASRFGHLQFPPNVGSFVMARVRPTKGSARAALIHTGSPVPKPFIIIIIIILFMRISRLSMVPTGP
ncbi:hypothetical protein R6Q57_009383 [Mikania cordata]